jgi:signal transduction histidine kinase
MRIERRQIRSTVAVLAGWSIMAVLFTPQHYVLSRGIPDAPPWTSLLRGNLAMFWTWAALTPVILAFGRRFPLERPHLPLHVLLHFLGGFAFTFAHIGIVRYVNALMTGRPLQPWFNFIVGYAATGALIAWGILAASQALIYFRRYQDRELRLVQAQLQSLKTQLHPHFLFNTLNAIAELIHEDAGRAERTVTQLSDLLRTTLTRSDANEVTLKEELDFLHNYVDIQQTLLQERLAVRWRISDATLDACVPAMLLQPLVENAIQHGVGPRATGGAIDISTWRHDGDLHITVEDDGVGLTGSAAGSTGIGLANTRARLRHMYGERHAFTIAARKGGGVGVTLVMPFRNEVRGSEGSDIPGEAND